jgi:murein L,D-transpeptidase YcbB/YkuD
MVFQQGRDSCWYNTYLRLLTVACTVALSAALGLAAQDSGVATRKTPASTKKSTGKAHSAHKSSQAKKAPATVHHESAAKSSATKPAITASKTAHRRTSNSSKKTATVSRRTTQQQPTPERYKEIQQALSDRGYFHGNVDGNWGADSVEAMKRFQHDQNIADDGKIGSLSLIALGLGPKRVARTESLEKPTQQP